MELKSITLKNFRKFDNLEMNFTEGQNEIRQPNRWGKTTLADAIAFVLVGKLNNGSSDLATIKPIRNSNYAPTEKLETVVELVFLLQNGELALKKEYGEQWVKTRGTTDMEMKGHYTNCYINSIKKTATEYEQEINNAFKLPSSEYLQILTNPIYFSQVMSWQKRREVINKVIGEVTPQEVIATNSMFKSIEKELTASNPDDLIKTIRFKLNDRESGLKRKADDLQAKIKGIEITNTVSEDAFEKAAKTVASNIQKIVALKVKREGKTDPVISALETDLMQTKAAYEQSKIADRAELERRNRFIEEKVMALKGRQNKQEELLSKHHTEVDRVKSRIQKCEDEIKTNVTTITRLESQMASKRQSWNEEQQRQFQPREALACPNCGHDINAELNAEALKQFNENKARRLKEITESGKELKAQAELLKARNDELTSSINELRFDLEDMKEPEVGNTAKEIEEALAKKQWLYVSDETTKLKSRIDGLELNLESEKNKAIDDDDICRQIDEIKAESDSAQAVIDLYNQQSIDRGRIKAWNEQLTATNKDIANQEVIVDLITEYRKARIDLLKERLQMVFGDIEFQLIQENIKADSWDEVCFVLDNTPYGKVPYETTNTERKLKIGIQIIEALKGALGCEDMPIIIDNAESITDGNRSFQTTAQTICMVADEVAQA
jgi:hypothetical protein